MQKCILRDKKKHLLLSPNNGDLSKRKFVNLFLEVERNTAFKCNSKEAYLDVTSCLQLNI